MKIYTLIILLIGSVFLFSCSSDNSSSTESNFVVAFKNKNIDINKIDDQEEIQMVFSKTAEQDGEVYIKMSSEELTYDQDFSTVPTATNSEIIVPIKKGQSSTKFIFKNLKEIFSGSNRKVYFEITKINYPGSLIQGFSSLTISTEQVVEGVISPEIGGPNEPNQVYVSLRNGSQKQVKRDSWDLGFYSGSHFRVAINSSIYMAVKALEETDFSKVSEASVKDLMNTVRVGTFKDSNKEFIDHPNGEITGTAISEIDDDDNKNPIYLLNMGYGVGSTTPLVGSVLISGTSRGWKKVRFLKRGNEYLIQYANLNDTTYQEKRIKKNSAYNFKFFSFNTNQEVSVEPEKLEWDLNFTVFTNLIEGNGSYGYSDYVINNLKVGVKAYRVDITDEVNYNNFVSSMIDESKFLNDQRAIGDSWRRVTPPQTLYTNRFYVLKDAKNNYYKIRMSAFLDSAGVRGYPKFEYKLLK